MINAYDREALRNEFQNAKPFPHLVIENFLDEDFVREVSASYPDRAQAAAMGRQFGAINEKGKIQVTESSKFPAPVQKLNELLAGPEFLADLEYITGIDNLLADAQLAGGGMHVTGARGRLDVHVDFNYVADRKLHRRLNILVYLNPEWKEAWGGAIELWDKDVKRCHRALLPKLNRCVLFETSGISYHGVQPVTCPDDTARISFAAYYYTREAPAGWDGTQHSTIFRARPHEKLRGYVLMPLERVRNQAVPELKQRVKKLIGRS